jgi:hypothetical protein
MLNLRNAFRVEVYDFRALPDTYAMIRESVFHEESGRRRVVWKRQCIVNLCNAMYALSIPPSNNTSYFKR